MTMREWSSRGARRFRWRCCRGGRFAGWCRTRSIDQFGAAGTEQLGVWPALAEHPFEVRPNDAVVTLFERGMQFEDRFARAIDQAARLAMRDRHVAADEIHRQLDDHPNTAES